MNEKEYRAVVIRDYMEDEGIVVFFQLRNGAVTNGIQMTDHEKLYNEMKDSQLALVEIVVADGTTPVELEDQLKNNPEFKDVFFSMKDIGTITISEGESNIEKPVKDILKDGKLLGVLTELFSDEEIWSKNE